jgi:V8-like Glu-specific endopeptidase
MRSRLRFFVIGIFFLPILLLPVSALAAIEPSVGHQVNSNANVNAFWTPKKMRQAERFDPMRGWLKPGEVESTGSTGQSGASRHRPPALRPSAVGRLFFTWLGRPASCSGSVIDTRSQRLVLTAGHCLNYLGVWSRRMMFAPDYEEGWRPYGSYRAHALWTTGPWARISWEYGMNFDIGIVVTGRTWTGRRVGDIVGSLPFETFPRRNGRTQILGYPAGRLNGRKMRACYSRTWAGPRISARAPGPFGMAARCDMAAGSSGGPWMSAYESGNGATEWIVDGLTSTGSRRSNVKSSPYFGSHFQRLIWSAEP